MKKIIEKHKSKSDSKRSTHKEKASVPKASVLQPSAKKGPGVVDVQKTAFFLNWQAAKNKIFPPNTSPAARNSPPPPASEGSKFLKNLLNS